MDAEFIDCNCGRNREVATHAQAFVKQHETPAEAYQQALYKTIERQPEWTDDCSFWDCVADYIGGNYEIDDEAK